MIEFAQNELTHQVAQSARDFAQQYIKPHLMEWDESQEFPVHIFKELGKLGMMGVLVPEKYGGSGLGNLGGLTATQCVPDELEAGMPYRLVACLPPLAVVYFRLHFDPVVC